MGKEKNLKDIRRIVSCQKETADTINSIMNKIRANILTCMKERNFKLTSLAKATNIPEKELYELIYHERVINVFELKRIADALNVKMEDLLESAIRNPSISKKDLESYTLKILNEVSLVFADHELNSQ